MEQPHSPGDEVGQARLRVRSVVASLLVVLAAIAVTAASIAVWIQNVALDTDAWMEIVEPSLTSEEFLSKLSLQLSDSAIEALDAEARLEERFSNLDEYLGTRLVDALDLSPEAVGILQRFDIPRFSDLAAPMSETINQQIEESIDTWVHSDTFETALIALVRSAHSAAVTLIEEDVESLEHLYIDDGQLKWNAIPLAVSAIETVIEEGLLGGEDLVLPDLSDNPVASVAIQQLSDALDLEVSEDFGQVTVMTEDQFNTIQGYGDAFNRLMWALVVGAVVLLVLTVVVSPHRRRTVLQASLAVLAALVLASLTTQTIVESIQESFLDPASGRAFFVVAGAVISSLRSIWIGMAVLAVLILLGGYLAGRPSWLSKVIPVDQQEEARPTDAEKFAGAHFDLLAIAAVIVALVAIWLIGLSWLWTPIVLALLGLVLWYAQTSRSKVAEPTSDVDSADQVSADAE